MHAHLLRESTLGCHMEKGPKLRTLVAQMRVTKAALFVLSLLTLISLTGVSRVSKGRAEKLFLAGVPLLRTRLPHARLAVHGRPSVHEPILAGFQALAPGPRWKTSPVMQFGTASAVSPLSSPSSKPKKVAVFGGTGYVGSAVCERLVKQGYTVTAVSRRGVNPRPDNENLSKVTWIAGDATDPAVVQKIVDDNDAVVHAVGLLFDVNSGLANLNTVVSGSGSLPGESSTYDAITRQTMFNVIDAIERKPTDFSQSKFPLAFVSCAEAGWPDVPGGKFVDEKLAPEWLKRYLTAKRAVEARLGSSDKIRSCMMRPSLIWDWTKLDVLPAIPIFNLLSALGVPFVDKTVRVETLADAMVQCIKDDDLEGVQRYMQMEELAKRE